MNMSIKEAIGYVGFIVGALIGWVFAQAFIEYRLWQLAVIIPAGIACGFLFDVAYRKLNPPSDSNPPRPNRDQF
jgi:uncharacterized membrane protein YoaK (UPF0700 family)